MYIIFSIANYVMLECPIDFKLDMMTPERLEPLSEVVMIDKMFFSHF